MRKIPGMMQHRWWCVMIIVATLGCGGPPQELIEQQGVASDSFRVIETAYRAALTRGVPKTRDDLAKHLPPGANVDALFTSPRDKQPIVVVWGTDLSKLMTNPRPVVYAYEAKGADGSRFVLTTMGVMEMTDEDFSAASFPAGHSPTP